MKAACTVLTLLLFAGMAAANPLPEGYAGLDQNADFACSPDEMGFDLTAANQGQSFSVDVFFDMIAEGLWSVACTFCVQDKSLVSGETFTYAFPAGWTTSPMKNSDDHILAVSPWIPATYPNFRCYVVDGTDFTFTTPLIAPFSFGTFSFTYAAAEEGCVGFLIDGANSGFLTTGFLSGNMGIEGQTCPPYECTGGSSTESGTWGGVKSLFR